MPNKCEENNDEMMIRLPSSLKGELRDRYPRGELSRAVRKLFIGWVASGRGKKEEKLRRLAEIEPEYLCLKTEIAELEATERREEDEMIKDKVSKEDLMDVSIKIKRG